MARKGLTSGYVLIMCVLVELDFYILAKGILLKKLDVILSLDWHVLRNLSQDVLRHARATRSSKRELTVFLVEIGIITKAQQVEKAATFDLSIFCGL